MTIKQTLCAVLVATFATVGLGISGAAHAADAARADADPVPQGDLSSPYFDNKPDRGLWSVMIFGGQLTENELSDIVVPTEGANFTDTSFIGAALNKEVWRWKGFSVEAEGGIGYQFGDFRGQDNSSFQAWGALYGRYDAFPWNHIIHTSIAGSIGLNYTSEKTAFENFETPGAGQTKNILHYFSPEIAFSLPSDLNKEVVFRLHHRSGASGAFGCDGCGSNFVTVGYRHRF
ncbi:hypothetical protein [Ahrensia sp. R2A130]|uniref:hypothetical protein n=1 Tax=Ahrensia sp. R2A130 TaxID=744979 RepID=UPI0003128C8E|nr:hypothetical protein [Ahrensia sp. R2A130]